MLNSTPSTPERHEADYHQLQLQGSLQQLLSDSCCAPSEAAQLRCPATIASETIQSQGEFLRRLCHELSRPLENMRAYGDWLEDVAVEPAMVEAIGALQNRADELTTLVDDLAELARIEQGEFVVRTAPADPRKLLHDIARLAEVNAQQRGLEFSLTIAPDLPKRVEIDAARVRQILFNLVSNAINFTESGRVGVTADIECGEESSMLRFRVIDTGPGISADRLPELFQPFPDLKGSSDQGHKYGGLGLALNYRLAKLLGGKIRVESRLSHGTEFALELPIEVRTSKPTAIVNSQERQCDASSEDEPELVGKFLVVESDGQSRMAMLAALRNPARR